MKSNTYIFIFFLFTPLLITACTDDLTGNNETQELESVASANSLERMADLSLDIEVHHPHPDSIPDTIVGHDSLAPFIGEVIVSNEGPADATGIQVAFTSNASCQFVGGYDNEGNLLRDVTLPAGGNTGDDDDDNDGVDDIILVDILGVSSVSASTSIEFTCIQNIHEYTRLGAEIIRSDQLDPDSTPGNGDATEDDQVDVLTEPEVPPCPDCPN
ncbi:MAG: hypothetical protein KTR29_13825 [Rhodothermaceae bacterium]|nr:hypothetical protein [Rhodothermaceae bacterium]